MLKRIFFPVFLLVSIWTELNAQVSVTFYCDPRFKNEAIVKKMEANLSKVLTEINNAYAAHREINVVNLPMTQFAKNSMSMLWSTVMFRCDGDDVDFVEPHLWNFSSGYMARGIPMLLTPRDKSGKRDIYQEVTVDFDLSGNITDFVFSSITHFGTLERGGDPVTIERKAIILQYCDRFRTAYNTKNIEFIEQVFSDDALIITGSVVKTQTADGIYLPIIKYNKKDKKQYIRDLRRVFDLNAWIEVTFNEVGSSITQSRDNPNFYGVRLKQSWKSSRYSDEGYVFLLWDFTNAANPIIHVRTWQPEYVGNKPIDEKELFSLENFED